MKLIGYVRVSSEEQAASGLSLENQESKIRAYAALYGHELIDIIVDAGFSAKSLMRPGMQAALAYLDSGKADGILILKLDRLTRSTADMGSLIDRYFSEKAGKALVSVSDQIDTTTAGGRLVLNVLTSVAQWEREVIAERTRDALTAKGRRGERKGGQAPIGTRWESKALVTNAEEAKAVELIKALRDSGMSIRAIVAELNKLGVPLERKGAKWHLTTVARILKAG